MHEDCAPEVASSRIMPITAEISRKTRATAVPEILQILIPHRDVPVHRASSIGCTIRTRNPRAELACISDPHSAIENLRRIRFVREFDSLVILLHFLFYALLFQFECLDTVPSKGLCVFKKSSVNTTDDFVERLRACHFSECVRL